MRAWAAFRLRSQAVISRRNHLGRRSYDPGTDRAGRRSRSSTMLSQLACLGGVVELGPSQDPPGFGGRERLIQGAGRVGR
jgi:hypothetical protein